MSDIAIPVIVIAERHDDVEFFNRTLRDAGHAVRCRAIRRIDELEVALENDAPHLLIFFADGHSAEIGEIAGLRQLHSPMSSLIVIVRSADEAAISEAMAAGAQDLVSVEHKQRICAVSEREIRSFRLERSLKEALHAAMQHKKQLKSLLSNSTDAIAVVQEGIVIEANQAWADLFTGSDVDACHGPLMDLFAGDSQASLKGALVACYRGQQERSHLNLSGRASDNSPFPVALTLERTTHDGEPAVHLSIEREQPATVPDNAQQSIVEQTLHTDLATGFLQRRQFLELLAGKLKHMDASGTRALAFLRPDRFEQIESDLGPVSSEEVIGQIAEVLDGLMSDTDLGGRFSGKVLALVIERDNLRDVETWAENALSRISERLFEVADHSLSLTCSIGLAELGAGTDRLEDLARNAERALERAVDDGGNCSVLEETRDESTRIKRIDEIRIRQIKAALVEGRFRLMHLNIASLGGRSERMYDTFVRMVDEQGDELAATEFMESAGRNGLLRAIDRWVIDASLDFCEKQASDVVFVKLSHESILDATLVNWIQDRTAESNVKPGRICFQVTENDASRYQRQTILFAESLRRVGYRFAIEHFGLGRDSMRVLASTPMDYVKFDGALSENLREDTQCQDKVRQFVATANRHDIKTIATHIENANTMALLFQLGVSYMEGHYLQEPDVVLEEAI
jgi:diguanylate cyclase (GGDEF)-like protein